MLYEPRRDRDLEPIRPDADLQKLLDKRGEGVSAVAFTVQDAGKAKAKAEDKGIRVVGDVSVPDGMGLLGGLKKYGYTQRIATASMLCLLKGIPITPNGIQVDRLNNLFYLR